MNYRDRWALLAQRSNLPEQHKALLRRAASTMDKHGVVAAPVTSIAHQLGRTDPETRRLIAHLVEWGWLERLGRRIGAHLPSQDQLALLELDRLARSTVKADWWSAE